MSDYHGRMRRLSERGSFGSAKVSARAAISIAAEADAEIARLREALEALLQLNDGLPMTGIEATRRIEVARAALTPTPNDALTAQKEDAR